MIELIQNKQIKDIFLYFGSDLTPFNFLFNLKALIRKLFVKEY